MNNTYSIYNQKTKPCAKCNEEKTLVSYSNLAGAYDGKMSVCRTCVNLEAQENDSDELLRLRLLKRRYDKRVMNNDLVRETKEVWE